MRPIKIMWFMIALAAAMPAASAAGIVGFQSIRVENRPEAPLDGGVWYPAVNQKPAQAARWPGVVSDAPPTGRNLSLVVLSHGGGASYETQVDTAIALARAGFVVAAVNHAGDDYKDQSRVLELWRRPAQLHRLISFMLTEWPEHRVLDDGKVGALGYSNGGFTVLVAAGGVPDLTRIGPYCMAHPEHDLCTALHHAGVDPQHLPIHVPQNAWVADHRIKALVVAAPAFGFTFSKQGLGKVRVPVQLWRPENDRHQPNPYYDEAVRRALPKAPEYHVVRGAGHFDFLPPCDNKLAAAAPEICSDPTGFDRAAFHTEFNADVVKFFRAHLAD